MRPDPYKRYSVIYADPPWSYDDQLDEDRRLDYPTMSLDEIAMIPVEEIAADDAILFMWETGPQLEDIALKRIMNCWGFKFKTIAFAWVKTSKLGNPVFGMGNWTRQNIELCMLGVRGRPLERVDASVNQIIFAPRTEHSRKPAEARDRIVKLLGDLPRVELFARSNYFGWEAWGNQCPDSITMPESRRLFI